jgi:hypothetical protein
MTEQDEKLKGLIELLRQMVCALVDEPDQVRIEPIIGTSRVGVDIHVADGDLGKVIGKTGRTARALRTIMGAAAMKHNMQFSLAITEPEEDL